MNKAISYIIKGAAATSALIGAYCLGKCNGYEQGRKDEEQDTAKRLFGDTPEGEGEAVYCGSDPSSPFSIIKCVCRKRDFLMK